MGKKQVAPEPAPSMIADTTNWKPVITQLAPSKKKKEPKPLVPFAKDFAGAVSSVINDRLG